MQTFHEVISRPEYLVTLENLTFPNGAGMSLIHIDVHQFSKSVLQRLLSEWRCFRSCTDAPIFGIEPTPNDTRWEHFVSLFGFQRVPGATDGADCRVFVSFKDLNHEPRPEPNADKPD